MADNKQIQQWLKDGTITPAQAKKMQADSSLKEPQGFISVAAIIGITLILIGLSWLIGRNWEDIPEIFRTLILVIGTVTAYGVGIFLRKRDQKKIGKFLLFFGALLLILSLLLIATMYDLAVSRGEYAIVLLIAWSVLAICAYTLHSYENLFASMLAFFVWPFLQYSDSITNISNYENTLLFGLVIIFVCAGTLFFGLSVWHKSIRHPFTDAYQFWTAFYFFGAFYMLSFQAVLPIISEYSLGSETFTVFLILFGMLSLVISSAGLLFAMNKKIISLREIGAFLGVLFVLFVLVLSTKMGAGLIGICADKTCRDFSTPAECSVAPESLRCGWTSSNGYEYCSQIGCGNFNNEASCTSDLSRSLGCIWDNCNPNELPDETNSQIRALLCERGPLCRQSSLSSQGEQGVVAIQGVYENNCRENINQKESCLAASDECVWKPKTGISMLSEKVPALLVILWIVNNLFFVLFILLVLWYGQRIGSEIIVNLAFFAFILEIISRYIGFWISFEGYLAFGILSILGGLILIVLAWKIPKWRRKLLEKTHQNTLIS